MVVEPDPTDHDLLRFGPVDREDGKLGPNAPTARWTDEPVDGGIARWLPEARDWEVNGWWVTASLMVGRRRELTERLVHNLEPKRPAEVYVRHVERELTDREKKRGQPNPHDDPGSSSSRGAPKAWRPVANEPPPAPYRTLLDRAMRPGPED
jgi:hypothetical protein